MRMRVSRDQVLGGHPRPHIWNQGCQFAYSVNRQIGIADSKYVVLDDHYITFMGYDDD